MFEDNSVRALILSFMAGMSTLLGTLIVFIVKKKSEKLVSASFYIYRNSFDAINSYNIIERKK